jgi:hypothetical protein
MTAATLRYYISREDRGYFNTLTQELLEICASVVNSAGAQEDGEQQDAEVSASRTSAKRKRAVKPREDEAKGHGVREAILRKLPKPTNSARPVQHWHVQRSGRLSRKPVDVYSALHCA